MMKSFKKLIKKSKKANLNQSAKMEQLRNGLAFLLLGGLCYGFYLYSSKPQSTLPTNKNLYLMGY